MRRCLRQRARPVRRVGGALWRGGALGIAITDGGRCDDRSYRSPRRFQDGTEAVVAPRMPGTT
jgi:hypothetical protein